MSTKVSRCRDKTSAPECLGTLIIRCWLEGMCVGIKNRDNAVRYELPRLPLLITDLSRSSRLKSLASWADCLTLSVFECECEVWGVRWRISTDWSWLAVRCSVTYGTCVIDGGDVQFVRRWPTAMTLSLTNYWPLSDQNTAQLYSNCTHRPTGSEAALETGLLDYKHSSK